MPAAEHAPDHLFLHAAEVVEAEDAFEKVVRVGHLLTTSGPSMPRSLGSSGMKLRRLASAG